MAGIDITTVKELFEHKTLSMTLRYAQLAPSHKVKALDILDGKLTGRPSAQKRGYKLCVKLVTSCFHWHAQKDSNLRPSDS